jgi:hypothetical protein
MENAIENINDDNTQNDDNNLKTWDRYQVVGSDSLNDMIDGQHIVISSSEDMKTDHTVENIIQHQKKENEPSIRKRNVISNAFNSISDIMKDETKFDQTKTNTHRLYDKMWIVGTRLLMIIGFIIFVLFTYIVIIKVNEKDMKNLNMNLSIKNAIQRKHKIVRPISMIQYKNVDEFANDKHTDCHAIDIMSKSYQTTDNTLSIKTLYIDKQMSTIIIDNITDLFSELEDALDILTNTTDYVCTFHFKYSTTFFKKNEPYIVNNIQDEINGDTKSTFNLNQLPCMCLWRLNTYQKLEHIEKTNKTILYKILDLNVTKLNASLNTSNNNKTIEFTVENNQFSEKSSRHRKYQVPIQSKMSIHDWNPLSLKKVIFEDVDAVISIMMYDEWIKKKISN